MIKTGKFGEDRYYMDIFKKIVAVNGPFAGVDMSEASAQRIYADIEAAILNNWDTVPVSRRKEPNIFRGLSGVGSEKDEFESHNLVPAADLPINKAAVNGMITGYRENAWKFFKFIDESQQVFGPATPGQPKDDAFYKAVAALRLNQLMFGRFLEHGSQQNVLATLKNFDWGSFQRDRFYEFLVSVNFLVQESEVYTHPSALQGLRDRGIDAPYTSLVLMSPDEFAVYLRLAATASEGRLDFKTIRQMELPSHRDVRDVLVQMHKRYPELMEADVPRDLPKQSASPTRGPVNKWLEARLPFMALQRFAGLAIPVPRTGLEEPAATAGASPKRSSRPHESGPTARVARQFFKAKEASAQSVGEQDQPNSCDDDLFSGLDVLFQPAPEAAVELARISKARLTDAQKAAPELVATVATGIRRRLSTSRGPLGMGSLPLTGRADDDAGGPPEPFDEEDFFTSKAVPKSTPGPAAAGSVSSSSRESGEDGVDGDGIDGASSHRSASATIVPLRRPVEGADGGYSPTRRNRDSDVSGLSDIYGSEGEERGDGRSRTPTHTSVPQKDAAGLFSVARSGGIRLGGRDLTGNRVSQHIDGIDEGHSTVDEPVRLAGASAAGTTDTGRHVGSDDDEGGSDPHRHSGSKHSSPSHRIYVEDPYGPTSRRVVRSPDGTPRGIADSTEYLYDEFVGETASQRGVEAVWSRREPRDPVRPTVMAEFIDAHVNNAGGIFGREKARADQTERATRETIRTVAGFMESTRKAPHWLLDFETKSRDSLAEVQATCDQYQFYIQSLRYVLRKAGLADQEGEMLKLTPSQQRLHLAYHLKDRLIGLILSVVSSSQSNDQARAWVKAAFDASVGANHAQLPDNVRQLADALRVYAQLFGAQGTPIALRFDEIWNNAFLTESKDQLMLNRDILAFVTDGCLEDRTELEAAIDLRQRVAAYRPIWEHSQDGVHPADQKGDNAPEIKGEKFDPKKGAADLVRYLAVRKIREVESRTAELAKNKISVKLRTSSKSEAKPQRTTTKELDTAVTYGVFGLFMATAVVPLLIGLGNLVNGPVYNGVKAGDRWLTKATAKIQKFFVGGAYKWLGWTLGDYGLAPRAAENTSMAIKRAQDARVFRAYRSTFEKAENRRFLGRGLTKALGYLQKGLSKVAIYGLGWVVRPLAVGAIYLAGLVQVGVNAAVEITVRTPAAVFALVHYVGYKLGIKLPLWILKSMRNGFNVDNYKGFATKLVYFVTAPAWGSLYVLGSISYGIQKWLGADSSFGVSVLKALPRFVNYWGLGIPRAFANWYEGRDGFFSAFANWLLVREQVNLRDNIRGTQVVLPTEHMSFRQAPRVTVTSKADPARFVTRFADSRKVARTDREVARNILKQLKALKIRIDGQTEQRALVNGILHHAFFDGVADEEDVVKPLVIKSSSDPIVEGEFAVVITQAGSVHRHDCAKIVQDLIFGMKQNGTTACGEATILKYVRQHRKRDLESRQLKFAGGVLSALRTPVAASAPGAPNRTMSEILGDRTASFDELVVHPDFNQLLTTSGGGDAKILAQAILILRDNGNWRSVANAATALTTGSTVVITDRELDQAQAMFADAMREAKLLHREATRRTIEGDLETAVQFLQVYESRPSRITFGTSSQVAEPTRSDIPRYQADYLNVLESNFVESFPLPNSVPVLAQPIMKVVRFQMLQEEKLLLPAPPAEESGERTVPEPLRLVRPSRVLADRAEDRTVLSDYLKDSIETLVARRNQLQLQIPLLRAAGRDVSEFERSLRDIEAALSYFRNCFNSPVSTKSKSAANAENRARQTTLAGRARRVHQAATTVPIRDFGVGGPIEIGPEAMTLEEYLALYRPAVAAF